MFTTAREGRTGGSHSSATDCAKRNHRWTLWRFKTARRAAYNRVAVSDPSRGGTHGHNCGRSPRKPRRGGRNIAVGGVNAEGVNVTHGWLALRNPREGRKIHIEPRSGGRNISVGNNPWTQPWVQPAETARKGATRLFFNEKWWRSQKSERKGRKGVPNAWGSKDGQSKIWHASCFTIL